MPCRAVDEARVDGHALPADQTLGDATRDDRLEQVPQQLANAEAPLAVLRKRRVIRHAVRQLEPAKPPICEVQMDLLEEPSLGPNAEAVPHDQHANQQIRIDRGAACVAVERSQVMPDTGQIDEAVDGSQQVIVGDVILHGELVEQRALRLLLRSQHRRSPASILKLIQRPRPKSTRDF